MKDRIRQIRKEKKLTQVEFGEIIGVKGNTITNYESGLRNPTDAVILSICREFNVNEEWLRTGKGEMYIKQSNDLVAKAAQMLGKKDPLFEAFVETYAELGPSDREILLNTGMKFLKNMEKYIDKS